MKSDSNSVSLKTEKASFHSLQAGMKGEEHSIISFRAGMEWDLKFDIVLLLK